jgi:hypothetical protein
MKELTDQNRKCQETEAMQNALRLH